MKKIELKELQKLETEILLDIDRVCRKNKIKYSIFAGTLIGAIRHKGFVPWDDDIDVILPREEYNRFIEVYSKEKAKIFDVASSETNKEYPFPYVKIYNNTTISKEEKNKEIKDLGVFVDVFPLDNISTKNKNKRLKKIDKAVKLTYMLSFDDSYYKQKPIYKRIIRSLLKIVGSRFFIKRLTKMCIVENKNKCDEIGLLISGTGNKNSWPREYFDSYIEVDFDGNKFFSIKEYDSLLRQRYGDYMKFPPKSDRIGHHYINAFYKTKNK